MAHSIGEHCVFCQIVGGTVQSHNVFEDAVSLTFLDHRPLFPGHCLLVPKGHYETLLDLPAVLLPPLFATTQLLARALEIVARMRVGKSFFLCPPEKHTNYSGERMASHLLHFRKATFKEVHYGSVNTVETEA